MDEQKKWKPSCDLETLNVEVDLIEAEVKALKEGLISREVFDSLMLDKSKVPVVKRYHTLLKCVHETLQKKLQQYELYMSSFPDSNTTALFVQAVDEGLVKRDVLDSIASLHSHVPVVMRTRYLLVSMQAAFQEKLESFRSHLLAVQSHFKMQSDAWLKVDKYLKTGLINKSVLTPIFLFPKQEEEQVIHEKNLDFHPLQGDKSTLLKKYRDQAVKAWDNKITLSCIDSSQNRAITTLGSHHLFKIIEFLVDYSYDWKSIGIALNFRPQDLKMIEANPLLLHNAPKSYLFRLLEGWIQRTLEHTLPPTIENLKEALSSQTVGLGALGSELQAIVSKSPPSLSECTINHPYSSTKVSFDAIEPSVFPINNEIYIKEGESTLLEVIATSGDPLFNWVMKGKGYGTQPILCLQNADIVWDSDQISCEVSSTEISPPVVIIPITMHVSCPLDEFTPILSSLYLRRPEVPKDTWPPTSSSKYISLAIIKQQKVNYGSEYARFTIRGDIDDILQHKETIDYEEIYDSLKSESQVMFIEGRPGSGKTTFVHKITRDWASNTSGGIRILLLVSLRVLNTIHNPNLSDILHLFRDLKVTPEIIEKRHGKGICFIFDGLDEFSPSDGKDSIVYKIIDKSYLHQSTVVVASRPTALSELRDKADKIVEVIGFSGNQIQEYFECYPFSDATKPAKLNVYLSLHPNILHMCYLPIHATMVAFLFNVTGEVPRTETEMYGVFTRFTLMRSISKNKEIWPNTGSNILQCLNEEEMHYFKQICQLALNKTLSNKQVLHQEEINSFFQVTNQSDTSLGLITIDRTADLYGFKDVYTFLHLTFQEYLAAYHISILDNDKQMILIEEHGHKNHMLVVWKFFCGLIDIKPFENKFKSILRKTEGNTLYHFQCAYESQQQIACAQFLKAVSYNIELKDKFLSTPDFTAIGYVTNKTVIPVKLSLANCDINIVAIDALLSEMEDTSKQSLENLHIEAKALNSELILKLVTNFRALKSLSLVMLSQEEVNSCCSTHLILFENFSVFKKIETLTLSGFQEESAGFRMIMLALRQCESLFELNVTDNKIGRLGAKYLCESLPKCRNLQRIDISNNGMSSDEALNVLHSMEQLKIKYIKGDEITSQNGSDLTITNSLLLKYLKPFTNLQLLDIVLKVDHVDLYMQSSTVWKDIKKLRIESQPYYMLNVTVAVSKSLKLHFNSIESFALKKAIDNIEGAENIAAALKQCPHLRILDLSDNEIAKEQLKLLLSVDFSRLEELYLSHNRIHNTEVTLLSSHLRGFQSLKKLNLSWNFFAGSGVKALAANLHHCNKLEMLDLEENPIGDDGARAVAAGLKKSANFQSLCLSRRHCHKFAYKFEKEGKQTRKKRFGRDTIEFTSPKWSVAVDKSAELITDLCNYTEV